jgi:hypothetical protein
VRRQVHHWQTPLWGNFECKYVVPHSTGSGSSQKLRFWRSARQESAVVDNGRSNPTGPLCVKATIPQNSQLGAGGVGARSAESTGTLWQSSWKSGEDVGIANRTRVHCNSVLQFMFIALTVSRPEVLQADLLENPEQHTPLGCYRNRFLDGSSTPPRWRMASSASQLVDLTS